MTATESPSPTLTYPTDPWPPMTVMIAATIMVALDSTIVNVALHQIGTDLGAGNGIEWIVTSYLLAVCAVQPATGWLADRFGRKRVFLTSLAAFTVASALCATAPNLGVLVLFRAIQGAGGGAIMPIGMAMGLEIFPPDQRGRAMATWGIAAMAAPAIGPTVGGWLVTAIGWHWLFLINVPIGAAALVAGVRLLPDVGHRERRSLDVLGLVLGGGGLAVFVLGIGQGTNWGWGSGPTVLCLVLGVGALLAFVRHELRTGDPLIELRMFQQRSFKLSVTIIVLLGAAQYARMVFIPLMLQSLRGYTAFRVGLLFIAPAVASAVGMRIGGRLVDSVGPRRPIVLGCGGLFLATLPLTQMHLGTPVWTIGLFMSLGGLAWGLTTSPTLIAGVSELPPRLVSQGTAMRSLAGQVSGAVAVAGYSAVLAARAGSRPTPAHAQAAFSSLFWLSAVAVLGAVALAYRLRPTETTVPVDGLVVATE